MKQTLQEPVETGHLTQHLDICSQGEAQGGAEVQNNEFHFITYPTVSLCGSLLFFPTAARAIG